MEENTSPYRIVGAPPRPSREPGRREACLVILYGENLGSRVALESSPVLVGRGSQCELRFDEECVSRTHCRIEPDPATGGWRVVDLGSTNGTFVNDRSVQTAPLTHGDQLQIGRNICKFLDSGHIESAYHEEIYRVMTTDGLTRLANRRAFEESLQREFSRSTRYTRPLSVIVLDIDHFKRINDTYGHLAGDAALRQIAQSLASNLRRDDIAGRLGGEEFIVLLPEIDRAGAVATAEKLRRIIAARQFEFEGTIMQITVSAGVATRAVTDNDPIEMVRRADELLYAAKREGRNRVRS
ncbi:MAG: GGDEF domain-containing protein [Polyangiales bacterium]